MCTKCITFLVGLTLIASTSIISRPFLDNSQEPPLIFSEISKSRFLNNSDLIQKIIRDDNECLYTLHCGTTPVEYAIYLKAWSAVEILLALDQKERLVTYHGHHKNPLIHMMIEQNAPFWLLKSALQIQPNFCFILNPQQETALETLIKKDDCDYNAGLFAVAGSEVTPEIIMFAAEYKRIKIVDILLEFYRQELEANPQENLSEHGWPSADSANQSSGIESDECLETAI